MSPPPDNLDRYHRQMLLPGIGEEGQRRLLASHALIVGCGALGTCLADALARAGVGTLTLIDRDIVELTNLQRQILYDEEDVAAGMPKAEAAARRLRGINSSIEIHAIVDDFDCRNAERLAAGADILLDGLDNFETRYLLNDLAVAWGRPYIYGGAVGTQGLSVPVLPHPRHRRVEAPGTVEWSAEKATPCLRCVFPDPPPPGSSPTCDTAGVLGPLVSLVASHQATQAIKLLSGNPLAVDRRLVTFDVWDNETRGLDVTGAADPETCPCCGRGDFEYLDGEHAGATTSLCGRNAVQITPSGRDAAIDLAALARTLQTHGEFTHTEHLLRGVLRVEGGTNDTPIELTLFPNGRAIIKGTDQPEIARSIYSRYIGV